MEGPKFLKQRYDLHKSEEVATAAERTEMRTEESVSHKPEERIQNYLDRLQHILEYKNSQNPEKKRVLSY